MLSRLKKKVKGKKEISAKQMILIVMAGFIVMAIIKFKQSNPFVSHD